MNFSFVSLSLLSFQTTALPPEPEPGGGNSSICFFQHVSSWGEREGLGASLSRRALSFYWIPFLCADCWHSRTNSQTDEGGGEKNSQFNHEEAGPLSLSLPLPPSLSLPYSLVLSSPQPNDGLCSSSPPAYTSLVGKLLNNIPLSISVMLNLWHQNCYNLVTRWQKLPLF